MYHTTVCTTLTYTRKTGDSLTTGMHTNMHTQCWGFFSCKSKINVVFRNFVLTQICVHDIFDVFMCNNIRLYQALPIIICTSPNVTTQSRPFTSVLSCSLKYDILHVSLKSESFIDIHIYLYNLCTFFWQMWYIHFFAKAIPKF